MISTRYLPLDVVTVLCLKETWEKETGREERRLETEMDRYRSIKSCHHKEKSTLVSGTREKDASLKVLRSLFYSFLKDYKLAKLSKIMCVDPGKFYKG